MSSARQIRNIALIGFMGTGKSSVGRLLAEQLHFSFLDTDDLIESRAGKTIAAIFGDDGEAAFRQLGAGHRRGTELAQAHGHLHRRRRRRQ